MSQQPAHFTAALDMWHHHGDFSNVPIAVNVPMEQLRFLSGLAFNLWEVPSDIPQEGDFVAIGAGNPEEWAALPDGPLVRMHSACMFSELGDSPAIQRWFQTGRDHIPSDMPISSSAPSKECDCKAQRLAAQALIAAQGGLYIELVEQDGRGWGLDIKREIYRLHAEEGLDTVEACERLGLPSPDIRRYGHVATFLRDLGLSRAQLLTNNLRKVQGLEDGALTVIQLPHIEGVTRENLAYLLTKAKKLGHILSLDDLVALAVSAQPG